MERANELLEGEIPRRKFLGSTAATIAGGLAGCSGNGQEGSGNDDSASGGTGTDSPSGSGVNGSEADGTGDGSQGTETTEDNGSTGSTGNEPGEYPTQDTTGKEAELDEIADMEEFYSFKVDDYDFLSVEEFPEAERDELDNYEEALYFATFFPDTEEPTDEIYFLCDSSEGDRNISLFVRGEGGKFRDDALYLTSEDSDMSQEEFFRDRVDSDGIVHAVDLAEHDYAVEALHSGFGSE